MVYPPENPHNRDPYGREPVTGLPRGSRNPRGPHNYTPWIWTAVIVAVAVVLLLLLF